MTHFDFVMGSTESRVTVSTVNVKLEENARRSLSLHLSKYQCFVCCCFVQQMSLKHRNCHRLSLFLTCSSDNIWTDQNLLLDSDLPTGWRTIRDSTGTYYWHVATGATQWHHPRLSGTPQLLDKQVRLWLRSRSESIN